MENHSARELWANFLKGQIVPVRRIQPRVMHFYDSQEESLRALRLVLEGTKTSHTHCLQAMQLNNEILPRIYDFVVLTDYHGEARCIVKNSSVKLLPWFNVTDEMARTDGAIDLGLHEWKDRHWTYFGRELARHGKVPRKSMIVVHQKFELIYTGK